LGQSNLDRKRPSFHPIGENAPDLWVTFPSRAAATGKDQSDLIRIPSMHPRTQPSNFNEWSRTSLKCEFLCELLCVWSIRSSDEANGEGGITLPLVI